MTNRGRRHQTVAPGSCVRTVNQDRDCYAAAALPRSLDGTRIQTRASDLERDGSITQLGHFFPDGLTGQSEASLSTALPDGEQGRKKKSHQGSEDARCDHLARRRVSPSRQQETLICKSRYPEKHAQRQAHGVASGQNSSCKTFAYQDAQKFIKRW